TSPSTEVCGATWLPTPALVVRLAVRCRNSKEEGVGAAQRLTVASDESPPGGKRCCPRAAEEQRSHRRNVGREIRSATHPCAVRPLRTSVDRPSRAVGLDHESVVGAVRARRKAPADITHVRPETIG